jgi:predicted DNA-binding transcriptional regulator YafY
MEQYQTTLTGLNLAEIQALFVPKSPHLLADLGWGQAFEAALLKLLAALPAANRQQAEIVSQRIHVDPTGWQHWDEEMSAFPVLQAAIWQELILPMPMAGFTSRYDLTLRKPLAPMYWGLVDRWK